MPKWTHVQRNRSAAPDVSWGLGLGGEQSKSPGTRASVLKDKAAEPAGSPAQVQQVCCFWKSEGANIYCTTSFCKSLGLSWKPARTWLLSWETCWTSVERRSWAPQVPVAAKTRGKWAVSPLNIGILQKFSWWNMISNMVKWWNSQDSIFVIELIQSQVTAFFVGFVIQRQFLMSSRPRSVGTTSSNETCLYGRYSN